ncbi:hypothetical protein MettiDRAFT_2212 [Methanolobus tindarius DSM 2278]|uniref:Uncharacterized protein n=1 Tax=Methanolobus tindarius DSM 2278 TaxID=1090322 RepID=W9DSF5_METTI|nr:hypothetical protein MettiDRAFT_2212 [Methanolobus tindarius DSM 2278]
MSNIYSVNLHHLLNPTKEKLYSFVILFLGLSLPKILNLFITIFVSRTFGPEKYVEYLMFKANNVPLILVTIIMYIVWVYLLITIIVNICEKCSCEKLSK